MRFLLLLLGFIVAIPALANWSKYSETDFATYYFDPATMKKNAGMVRVWELVDYKQRSKDGEMSARLLHEHDCKGDRSRELSLGTFTEGMATGKVLIMGDNPSPSWRFIPPRTVAATLHSIVCK